MNLNDSNQIKHYAEAERLLDESARVLKQVDAMLPGSDRRARLEDRLAHLEAQALVHAHLAGLVQPERGVDPDERTTRADLAIAARTARREH